MAPQYVGQFFVVINVTSQDFSGMRIYKII